MRKRILFAAAAAMTAFVLSEGIAAGDTHPLPSGIRTGRPGMNLYNHEDPGTTWVFPRAYPGAPPRVPHNAVDFTVTRADNDCVFCHLAGAAFADTHAATKIPASHYVNTHTNEKRDSSVVGIRYQCRQCHVPQSPNPPLPAAAPGS